jgi:peptidoglycan/xylan/chitin deacetylase (PgdA/CDA1 family)
VRLDRLEPAADRIAARAGEWRLRLDRGRHLAVLAYHAVDDPRRFGAQVGWLRAHTTLVDLDSVLAAMDGAPLPPRAVLLTFDDADKSVLERAAPLFARHAIPAVAFVVAGPVGTAEPWWWDEAGPERTRALKQMPNRHRIAILERLRTTSGPVVRRGHHLTAAELRVLATMGIEIGSHSCTHPCLDQCTQAEIDAEVTGSRQALAELTGTPPRAFAYPNGSAPPAARAAVHGAGYEVAFLHDHRRSRAHHTERFGVSRLRINSDDSLDRLRAVVSGVHPALHRARGGR